MSETSKIPNGPTEDVPQPPRKRPRVDLDEIRASHRRPLTPEQLLWRERETRQDAVWCQLTYDRTSGRGIELQADKFYRVRADEAMVEAVSAARLVSTNEQGVLLTDADGHPGAIALSVEAYLSLMRPHLANGSLLTVAFGDDAKLPPWREIRQGIAPLPGEQPQDSTPPRTAGEETPDS